MALDKSALLELTEALSSADDGQLMPAIPGSVRIATAEFAIQHPTAPSDIIATPMRSRDPRAPRRRCSWHGRGRLRSLCCSPVTWLATRPRPGRAEPRAARCRRAATPGAARVAAGAHGPLIPFVNSHVTKR